MDKGHWFWNSGLMDVVEKQLLNLTHWVWAKRHNSTEAEYVPKVEPTLENTPEVSPKSTVDEPARPAKRPAAKRTPKAPKGNEWNVKQPTK